MHPNRYAESKSLVNPPTTTTSVSDIYSSSTKGIVFRMVKFIGTPPLPVNHKHKSLATTISIVRIKFNKTEYLQRSCPAPNKWQHNENPTTPEAQIANFRGDHSGHQMTQ